MSSFEFPSDAGGETIDNDWRSEWKEVERASNDSVHVAVAGVGVTSDPKMRLRTVPEGTAATASSTFAVMSTSTTSRYRPKHIHTPFHLA